MTIGEEAPDKAPDEVQAHRQAQLQNNGKQALVVGTQAECPDLIGYTSRQQHEKHEHVLPKLGLYEK